ncbi:hypothetical protein PAXRUDRAFT_368127 [Paxillus rubicundulus Ve08.2h10]|uniref:Uncharacterized protein n=1 Tax=Paxillus rubicundulus Ve08.2h10 TaxID=930991 RepID=A0A0D0DHT4_9AGAM|nr:hypothetical protein PAXRUDRAFT_368127 [Paxillus rubicundulus Ve08.2h10]
MQHQCFRHRPLARSSTLFLYIKPSNYVTLFMPCQFRSQHKIINNATLTLLAWASFISCTSSRRMSAHYPPHRFWRSLVPTSRAVVAAGCVSNVTVTSSIQLAITV